MINTPLWKFKIELFCVAFSPSGSGQCTKEAEITFPTALPSSDTLPAKGEPERDTGGELPCYFYLSRYEFFGDDLTSLVPGTFNCQIIIDP